MPLLYTEPHRWCNSYHARLKYGFSQWSGQSTDHKIGICCFSAKHAAKRMKSKDWLARNTDNVSELSDMSLCVPADCCFSELAL